MLKPILIQVAKVLHKSPVAKGSSTLQAEDDGNATSADEGAVDGSAAAEADLEHVKAENAKVCVCVCVSRGVCVGLCVYLFV